MQIKNFKLFCPQCGSENVLEIVYGTLARPSDKGMIYGGCIIPRNPADWGCDWGCDDCGYQWNQKIKVSNPQPISEPAFSRPKAAHEEAGSSTVGTSKVNRTRQVLTVS